MWSRRQKGNPRIGESLGDSAGQKRDYGTEAERILRSADLHVQSVFRPLGAITLAIVQASTNCRDAAKKFCADEDTSENHEKEVYLFFEFIYFFMHMTLRKCFRRVPQSRLRLLQDFLLAMVPATAIDSYFAHWPDKLRNDLTDEFIKRLDEAEVEYGTCTPDGDVSRILALLADNVVEILGREKTDVSSLRGLFETVVNELEGMGLNGHILDFEQLTISKQEELRLGESLDQFRMSSRRH